MWGQAEIINELSQFDRIIPTRVGTRENFQRFYPMKQDHPHACGDKYPHRRHIYRNIGSSPRVWGQELVNKWFLGRIWIIPTRVGTRSKQLIKIGTGTDHPHACGDKAETAPIRLEPIGSSPRVWGQACQSRCSFRNRGIIPTRVGTSTCADSGRQKTRDHPHACGDKLFFMPDIYSVRGSSPRVWGQVQDFYNVVNNYRIIPTRVGTRLV